MPMDSSALRLLILGAIGLCTPAGCSDDASDPVGDDTDGAASTSIDDGDTDPTDATGEEGSIRGTFVFVNGSETRLDVEATYEHSAFGDVVQHSCGGTDLDQRLTLGISWRDGTSPGTFAPSLSDGPGFIAAWESADGEGIRATLPSGGEIVFDAVGDQPGDVVYGTAHAVLSPEGDDPDDRVSEIVSIEFRCVVAS